VHVHYLNEYCPELNPLIDQKSASPSSIDAFLPSQIDYFLEFYDISGSLTSNLKSKRTTLSHTWIIDPT
jgi:hypothetical protein